MATEDGPDAGLSTTASTDVFIGGARTVVQAFFAGIGTLSVLAAVEEYTTGYTPNPAVETAFVVLMLTFGLTLIFLSVSGVLAATIDHATD